MPVKDAVARGGGVKSITNLSRSGLQDWLIQRVTAVILLVYVFVLVGFFAGAGAVDFDLWVRFMTNPLMQIMNTLALVSLLGHAWIGLWTIATDYVKPAVIRFFVQFVSFLFLFVYLVWGLKVFWGL
jgi:succinate dehydrogenase / fumarate reductase membrane anchor subunit